MIHEGRRLYHRNGFILFGSLAAIWMALRTSPARTALKAIATASQGPVAVLVAAAIPCRPCAGPCIHTSISYPCARLCTCFRTMAYSYDSDTC